MKNTISRIIIFVIAYAVAVAVSFAAVPAFIPYWLTVLLFAVPLSLYGCNRFAAYRRDELSVVERQTLFVRLRTNRVLPYLASIAVGIAYGIFLPVYLVMLPIEEHIITILMIALIFIADGFIASYNPYKEANKEYRSRKAKSIFAVFAGGFLYALICFFAAVPNSGISPEALEGNNTAFVIAVGITAINSLVNSIMESVTVNSVGIMRIIAIFWFLAAGVSFYGLLRLFRAIVKFPAMIRNVAFSGEKNTDGNAERKGSPILAFLVVAFIVCFSATAVFVSDVMTDRAADLMSDRITAVSAKAVEVVESVDGILCKSGTIDKITAAGNAIMADTEEELIAAVNAYYDDMISNIDGYLDWYYSFWGQYTQLGIMLKGAVTGSIEDAVGNLIADKTAEFLPPDTDIEAELDAIYQEGLDQFRTIYEIIIGENRIEELPEGGYAINMSVSFSDIAEICMPETSVDRFSSVAIGSAISGVVTGVLAKKAVSKIMSKAASKLAVKSMSKLATTVLAPTAIGTAVGPWGTAIGFVGGALTWVATDLIGLGITEHLERDDYKTSMINAIEEERASCIESIETWFTGV